MDKELKEKVQKRIELTGLKKSYIAERIGLSKSQFSQTLSGIRKLTSEEETKLRLTLNL